MCKVAVAQPLLAVLFSTTANAAAKTRTGKTACATVSRVYCQTAPLHLRFECFEVKRFTRGRIRRSCPEILRGPGILVPKRTCCTQRPVRIAQEFPGHQDEISLIFGKNFRYLFFRFN